MISYFMFTSILRRLAKWAADENTENNTYKQLLALQRAREYSGAMSEGRVKLLSSGAECFNLDNLFDVDRKSVV